jgi:methylmalonyl-CoA mutase
MAKSYSLSDDFSLETDRFAPTAKSDWIALASKALKGLPFETLESETEDSISVQPLYSKSNANPLNLRPDGSWILSQRVDHPDIYAASDLLKRDINGGANGISLVCQGSPHAFGYGVSPSSASFNQLLGQLEEHTGLRFEPGKHALNDIQSLLTSIQRLGESSLRHVHLGYDPIGLFAIYNNDYSDEADLKNSVTNLFKSFSQGSNLSTVFRADGRISHNAGATTAQELGFTLSRLVWYLRVLADTTDFAAALQSVEICLSVDARQFESIAKLRAMRLLLNRLCEALGIEPIHPTLHAETSFRMLASEDAYTNIVRLTVASFSAICGGADSITCHPFSQAQGLPNAFARRIARNIQLVCGLESHLGDLADPAAGSGYIDALTEDFAEKAWHIFQAIEAEGGVIKALDNGTIQSAVSEANKARQSMIEDGTSVVVGVTHYKNTNDETPAIEDMSPLMPDTPISGMLMIPDYKGQSNSHMETYDE